MLFIVMGCSVKTAEIFEGEAVKLKYICNREISTEYEISDTVLINDIKEEIGKIEIGSKTDVRASDYDDIFVFETADNRKYTYTFNNHCIKIDGDYFEISNDDNLWKLVKEITDKE
ncbi:MAG: hypothetical protein ACI4WM_09180 [Erysipelotrichaceae bacterium]